LRAIDEPSKERADRPGFYDIYGIILYVRHGVGFRMAHPDASAGVDIEQVKV